MKNFLIDGIWQGPSEGIDVKEWLNEIVAYSGLDEHLQPTGVIRRFQKIERVRRNGRGRGKTLEAIAAEIDKLKNSDDAICKAEALPHFRRKCESPQPQLDAPAVVE